MNKMRKRLALLLTSSLLMGSLLVGCGRSVKQDVVKPERETLVMGTSVAFPPYEYYKDGKIVGIDAEIAAAIADRLDMQLKITDMDADLVLESVQTDRVNFGMSGIVADKERLQDVSFTDPYATNTQVIIVPKESEIKEPEDLIGHRIGVQEGTAGQIACKKDFGDSMVTVYPADENTIQALANGQVDAVVMDNEPAKRLLEDRKGMKILSDKYLEDDYVIVVDKENTELLAKINEAISDLIDDGTVQKIIQKHIDPKAAAGEAADSTK